MIRRPPRSTLSSSSAASDVYKRQDKHIVEDIVSDCFVKLWEQRKDIRIHTSVTNYLLTLVKNTAISFLRKKKLPQIEFEQVSNKITDDDAEIIIESEIYNKLYLALDKLPDQRRKILKMAAFEGKSYAQIGQELNISTNTVKTQMARAYRFLKSELAIPYKSILFFLSFFFSGIFISDNVKKLL